MDYVCSLACVCSRVPNRCWENQNTPCMAAWPSLTNSHTHLLLTSEEVRSQTKRCSSKHKHCYPPPIHTGVMTSDGIKRRMRPFQPRTQHLSFPRKLYILFLDNETCNGALLLFFLSLQFSEKKLRLINNIIKNCISSILCIIIVHIMIETT